MQETVRNTLGKIDWEKSFKTMEKTAIWGAKNGWTIPPDTTMRECYEMIIDKSKVEIDNEFEEFYSISQNYEAMKRELTSDVFGGKWKELLTECFENYEQENYKIVIPSLFLILEGAIFDVVKEQRWKIAFAENEEKIKDRSIMRPMFISVNEFLKNAYSYGNFDKATERPTIINRSWVLHGRDDISEWKMVDALRLFNALYTFAFLNF
jgi:hypothetical protein